MSTSSHPPIDPAGDFYCYNRSVISRVKNFLQKYEGPISSIALLVGFVFDSLTLRRADLLIENLVFVGYIFLTGVCIILINLAETGKFNGRFATRIHPWLSIIIQFSLGNLFSGFTVFYFRSSSIGASWPFLLFLVGLMIVNERLKKQYERLIFQTGTLFIAIFSYTIFSVPILVGRLGDSIFLLSGLASLFVVTVFITIIWLFAPDRVRQSIKGIVLVVAGIYLFITGFYFTNILPPIPLALKDIGVYHSLVKTNGSYILTGETLSWSEEFFDVQVIHMKKGSLLYVYSAVFSPLRLSTGIVHEWQWRNPGNREWITMSKISFPILSGRDGGYRGYSYKTALKEGRWRVLVKTPTGQVIGRTVFTIQYVDELPTLETTVVK